MESCPRPRCSAGGPRLGSLTPLCVSVVFAACGTEGEPAARTVEAAPEFRTTASIEEVMRYMIDPAADAVWDAVVTEVTADGVVETAPETDEDWELLRRHAVTLVESTNLLLMEERPVAAEGSRSELPGVDLEPEEIEALLAQDRDAWTQFVGVLHETGVAVLEAATSHDVDGLLVAGDRLDLACETCHVRYWYPSLDGQDTRR